jgi:hypothetical protein
MDEKLLAILISAGLFYYFNICKKSRCIVLNPKCDGISCYVPKNKK